ncbi:MAG: hypothetical protein HRU80_02570 [Ignavibacteriales bacterium]|nr:MAG: hypothetical protein HRU80_02570 [Ignavibacteriales bacterium]
MPLSVFLFSVNVFVWVVVSLRQLNGRYNYLFITYAVIELVQLVGYFVLNRYDYLLTASLGFAAIFILITSRNSSLKSPGVVLLVTSLVSLLLLPDLRAGFSLIVFQHAVIFIILLRDAFADMQNSMEINLFYVFMLLNEINFIFMYLSLRFSSGVLSDVSQLQVMAGTAIALWFTIFRYDRPKLGFKI